LASAAEAADVRSLFWVTIALAIVESFPKLFQGDSSNLLHGLLGIVGFSDLRKAAATFCNLSTANSLVLCLLPSNALGLNHPQELAVAIAAEAARADQSKSSG
jgi:hypothetical protein